ncbi:MAG: cysteine--tRNA ligase [Sphingomonadales bacterium]
MSLSLYNTLSRKKDAFAPADPKRVTLYVCGPTVYNYAHIGNARPPVVFDVLVRLLRARYGAEHVVYARNITDVDDKINASAHERGVDISVITKEYEAAYLEDMQALGVADPDIAPHATAHIPQMIAMMESLIEKGFAYAAEGHVLFNVEKFDAYGALSRRDMDEMIAGARVEVAPYKKNAADFVLWKPSDETQPGWDSPWGRGRPGWHLECSAMIEEHLGKTIDIHGGGHDLIFPHHENELAQSCCAHDGAPLARYWMHNGFLNMGTEKMSKSLGNVRLVREILEDAPGEAIRMALLSGHYRQPLEWTPELLTRSKAALDRYYQILRDVKDITPVETSVPDAFQTALEDDLNTPKALAELSALAKALAKAETADEKAKAKGALLAAGALIGLLQGDPETWFSTARGDSELSADDIEALLEERRQARKDRDFARADAIRDELGEKGVAIEDKGDGTTLWRWA